MQKIIQLGKQKNFQTLVGDSSWTLFSQVFIVIVNILSVYILANFLSQQNYGEFKIITTWLAIALGVGYTGYNYILPQKIARGERYDLKKIFLETFLKSLPTFFGLLIMSIYYLYNQNLNLGVGFFFAGLVAPTLCTAVLVNTYYMGRRDFKMFALAQNFVDVVQLLSIALLAYFSKDFVVITSAYFVATLVANILIVWQAVNGDKKYKMGKNIPQVLVGLEEVEDKKFKSKLNISAIIMGFTYQMDKLLIFHFIGAVPLAVYSIVTAIGDQARTPVKALASALFPRMTKDIFTKKKLFVSFGLLTGFCLVIFVTLFLLYPLIFEYLFPKYSEYIYLANLASITILFAPIQLLYLYCQSKNDLQTLNTYANLNTILQIVLFSASAFLVSLPMFLISRSLIMFISTIYLVFRINKL